MTQVHTTVAEDTDRSEASVSEAGAQSWRRMIWEDDGNPALAAKAAVWIAPPGVYPYPPRPIAETFVVIEGEADCRVAQGETRRIGPGDIVTIPVGEPVWLDVLKPFRKVAFVVPKP